MKICTRCKKDLNINYFLFNNKEFKTCNKCREENKLYRSENKEKIKKYRDKNKEKINIYQKQYKKENSEKLKILNKKYRIIHREKMINYLRNYNKIPKNFVRKFVKKLNVSTEEQLILMDKILSIFNIYYCPICNIKFEYGSKNHWNSKSIDHIVPKLNIPENFQIICMKCNTVKNNLDINELKLLCNDDLKIYHNNDPNILSSVNITSQRITNILYVVRKRAKLYNITYNLTKDYLISIINPYCPILNIKIDYTGGKMKDNSAQLDRIIPDNGYIIDNVRFVSKKANSAKHNVSIDYIKNVYDHTLLAYEKLGL